MIKKVLKGYDLELHRRFSEYGVNAKEWLRKCVLMLPEIDERRIWAKRGFGSLFEYAAKLAGMSKNQVYDALRIVRKVEDKPALKKIIEEKGVNAIRPVIPIVTQENQEFWAEKARELTRPELEIYVKNFREQLVRQNSFSNENNRSDFCTCTTAQPVKIPTTTVTMDLTPETLKQLEKLKGKGTWEEAMKLLLQSRIEKLDSEKPEPVKTESRYIPTKVRQFILKRDNGYCAFPGCTKPYHEIHHVQGFSIDGTHDPDKMFLLCKTHHDLAHRGLIENETKPAQFWRVRWAADRNSPRFKIDELVGERRR